MLCVWRLSVTMQIVAGRHLLPGIQITSTVCEGCMGALHAPQRSKHSSTLHYLALSLAQQCHGSCPSNFFTVCGQFGCFAVLHSAAHHCTLQRGIVGGPHVTGCVDTETLTQNQGNQIPSARVPQMYNSNSLRHSNSVQAQSVLNKL